MMQTQFLCQQRMLMMQTELLCLASANLQRHADNNRNNAAGRLVPF